MPVYRLIKFEFTFLLLGFVPTQLALNCSVFYSYPPQYVYSFGQFLLGVVLLILQQAVIVNAAMPYLRAKEADVLGRAAAFSAVTAGLFILIASLTSTTVYAGDGPCNLVSLAFVFASLRGIDGMILDEGLVIAGVLVSMLNALYQRGKNNILPAAALQKPQRK